MRATQTQAVPVLCISSEAVLTCPGSTAGDVATEQMPLFLRNACKVLQRQGTGGKLPKPPSQKQLSQAVHARPTSHKHTSDSATLSHAKIPMQDLRSCAAPLRAASDNTPGRSQPFRLSAFLAQKLRVLTCPGTTTGDVAVAAEDKGLFLRNAFQVLQLQGRGRKTLKAREARDGYPNLCMAGFLKTTSVPHSF